MRVMASRRLLWTLCTAMAVTACTDTESSTNLNPEGPPMLRQARLFHRVFDAQNPTVSFKRRVFGFGTHELATADEVVDEINAAIVLNNDFRLIIDELLVGNNLEEIACRSAVDDDEFQRIPLGANPDDIARCAVADEALDSSCFGATAVCVCQNDAGCARGVEIVEKGKPVGVLDQNQDGAGDDFQMIAGAVGIQCGDIDVPISLNGDQTGSYWNPSGDQNRPAMGGFDALGPALVLKSAGPLPTNLPCTITTSEEVVDKEGVRLCAPPNGDIAQSCTPGDMSAWTFRTEALIFVPASWSDGEMGVSRTADATFAANTTLATATIGNVTVQEGGAAFTAFTTELDMTGQLLNIKWTAPGLDANTTYTVTVTPQVTDTYGQGAPAPQTFTFTTGP